MSLQEAVTYRPREVPLRRRLPAKLTVGVARLLATLPPHRIRRVLTWALRGARPATVQEAWAARDTVVAVSLACSGREGCLPRSLATVLLCRLHGHRPVWCVGVRRLPPFYAHAWIEADGVVIDEDFSPDYLRKLFTVA